MVFAALRAIHRGFSTEIWRFKYFAHLNDNDIYVINYEEELRLVLVSVLRYDEG